MTTSRLESILSKLGLLDSSARLETGSSILWKLPVPEGADYRFWCLLYDDGEPQIGAERLDIDPDEYFWYRLFEDPDFASDDERSERFTEFLSEIVRFPSRILQRRGWLFWHFDIELEKSGVWRRVHGHACMKFGGSQVPNRDRRKSVYRSPALVLAQA